MTTDPSRSLSRWLSALLVAAFLWLAVGMARPAQAEIVNVTVAGMAFNPSNASVQMVQGEPGFPDAHGHVTWTMNDPGIEHTVTFENIRLASSGPLAAGQRHEVVFSFPGTFAYRCTIHPGETGTVVEPGATGGVNHFGRVSDDGSPSSGN